MPRTNKKPTAKLPTDQPTRAVRSVRAAPRLAELLSLEGSTHGRQLESFAATGKIEIPVPEETVA